MGTPRIVPPAVLALASALTLAGCGGMNMGSFNLGNYFGGSEAPEAAPQPLPAPEIPSSIRASEVVGRWGYAAYHRAEDRARTEAAARDQCRNAVVINAGPSGGVMLYPPDQRELQEFFLKGGPGGKNYLGPHGESGGAQDREIESFDGRVLIMRFIDPEISGRYGTGVYVRCAPGAGGVAKRGKGK